MLEKIKKLYHFSNTWTGTVIVVLLAIFFFAQAFVIPSGSMKDTYKIGDFLLVKKFAYGIPTPAIPFIEVPVLPDFDGDGHLISGNKPKRGDIVVFRYPANPKIYYVKRCVGVGGDKIMIRDKTLYLKPHEGDEFIRQNYLPDLIASINGELWVKNPYLYSHLGVHHDPQIDDEYRSYAEPFFDFGPIIVEEEHFFMMGDNREHSNDSRFWGSVPYKYIIGTPWFTYLSWEDRSYDAVFNGSELSGADHNDLQKVCKDIPIDSKQCKTKWKKNMYKIRWERMFKTPKGLEKLLAKDAK